MSGEFGATPLVLIDTQDHVYCSAIGHPGYLRLCRTYPRNRDGSSASGSGSGWFFVFSGRTKQVQGGVASSPHAGSIPASAVISARVLPSHPARDGNSSMRNSVKPVRATFGWRAIQETRNTRRQV